MRQNLTNNIIYIIKYINIVPVLFEQFKLLFNCIFIIRCKMRKKIQTKIIHDKIIARWYFAYFLR